VQAIEIYQSYWAMQLRQPGLSERSMEECFAMVAEAGFAGMGMDLSLADIAVAKEAKPLFKKYKLGCLFNAFPTSVEGFQTMLDMANEFDCRFLNVIGQVMPIDVQGMIPVVRRWVQMAEASKMPILFETHRHGITNDLYTTLQLLDAVPEMQLCADLSHFLIDREFSFPPSERDHELVRRILARSLSFQGRVASNEQIQVQISFPQHQKWYDLFAQWWEQGFRSWRARSGPDDCLNFMCELGPTEYAITNAQGMELSDRWEEALAIRERVLGIWGALVREDAPVG
jgi:hypothetical protein